MLRLLILLLLGTSLAAASAGILLAQPARQNDNSFNEVMTEDEDEEDEEDAGPARPEPMAIYEDARIEANGQIISLTEGGSLPLTRDTRYDVRITQLAPNSRVYVEFKKAGVVAGRQAFNANQRGEFEFEYTTPTNRIRGEAVIRYTPSNRREITRTVKVILD